MRNQFIKILNKHLNNNSTVFIAVSGGVDSMTLINLCLKNNITPQLLHCNFKLRDEESDLDENFIRSFAKKNSLALIVKSFDTEKIAKSNNQTIQECAREIRYNWFNTFLNKTNHILLTGHHLNDSVETFHINLLRGTGLTGLTGIPQKRHQIIRPLLSFSKIEIKAYAEKNEIKYREDSSNLNVKYRRNKIRHDIIPILESLESDYLKKVETTMKDLFEIDSYLNHIAKDFYNTHFIFQNKITKVNIENLLTLPQVILPKLFTNYGLNRNQIHEFIKLLTGNTGAIFKTKTHLYLKNRTEIQLKKYADEVEVNVSISDISNPIKTEFGIFKFEIVDSEKEINHTKNTAYFDFKSIKFPIKISNQFHSKKIKPFGMNGMKLISDILIDKKLSRFEKENQLVMENDNDVLWLVGITTNNDLRITKGVKSILKVTFKE